MTQFFKFPISVYKSEDMSKYANSIEVLEKHEDESDVDYQIRLANSNHDPEEEISKPEGFEVMVRLPTSAMEKCIFHDSWSLSSTEEDKSLGVFNACTITLDTGEEYLCTWSADKLEQQLKKANIIYF